MKNVVLYCLLYKILNLTSSSADLSSSIWFPSLERCDLNSHIIESSLVAIVMYKKASDNFEMSLRVQCHSKSSLLVVERSRTRHLSLSSYFFLPVMIACKVDRLLIPSGTQWSSAQRHCQHFIFLLCANHRYLRLIGTVAKNKIAAIVFLRTTVTVTDR